MASVATANHQHVVTSDAQRGELTHGSIREHAVTDHKITGKNYRITVIGHAAKNFVSSAKTLSRCQELCQ